MDLYSMGYGNVFVLMRQIVFIYSFCNFTQVSDLDFRQFVHMPVVLPASCCFR